jgi:LysM repeat protein
MKRIALLVFTFCSISIYAQSSIRITPEEYIALFKDAAIADMKKTKVPASITLAQGMYESDYGNSELAKGAKNHFGIKCHKEWDGPTFHQDDDAPNECFRKYKTVLESYDDHSNFLRSRERYKSLFELEITDYKGWAHGLKKAGYATNPAYASKIINIIERYNLNVLDVGGDLAEIKPVQNKEVEEDPKQHTPIKIFSPKPNYVNAKTINDVPFTRVNKGDTWYKIAKNYNLELWQILEFNEAEKNDIIHEGDIVFVKKKKARAEAHSYTVKEGDTMKSISQQYGVKLKKLYQMNHLEAGSAVTPGKTLQMRKTIIFGIVL